RAGDLAIADRDGGADDRPVDRTTVELGVRGLAGIGRQPHVGDQLVFLERRRQVVDDQVGGGDRPGAGRAAHGHRAADREQPGGPGGGSAWGAAWAGGPPIVPRFRTAGEPIPAAASATARAPRCTSWEVATARWRVIAPITISLPSCRIPVSSGIPARSTSASG